MMWTIFRLIGRTSAELESNFTVKKQNKKKKNNIFAEDLLKNKFALTPSICVRNGAMRLFV